MANSYYTRMRPINIVLLMVLPLMQFFEGMLYPKYIPSPLRILLATVNYAMIIHFWVLIFIKQVLEGNKKRYLLRSMFFFD